MRQRYLREFGSAALNQSARALRLCEASPPVWKGRTGQLRLLQVYSAEVHRAFGTATVVHRAFGTTLRYQLALAVHLCDASSPVGHGRTGQLGVLQVYNAKVHRAFGTATLASSEDDKHVKATVAPSEDDEQVKARRNSDQSNVDAQVSNIDDAVAQKKEKQTRTPWHREGSNIPPVARQRSAGAMTKGIVSFRTSSNAY